MNKFFLISLMFITLLVVSCENEQAINTQKIVQPEEILAFDPGFSQGYLILDSSKYPNLSYWKIDISSKAAKNESIRLAKGKNYWRIPEKLLQSGNTFKAKIVGLDASDNIVVESVFFEPNTAPPLFLPVGWPNLELGCTWKCVSDNYAWEIRLWHKENNQSAYLLGLHHTFDYYDEEEDIYVPYYSWISEEAFNTYCNSIGLPDFCTEPYGGIQRIGPRQSDGKYGVAKDLGPWEGSTIATPIDNLLNESFDCSWDLSAVIGRINIYGIFINPSGETFPDVSCSPVSPGSGGVNEPSGNF